MVYCPECGRHNPDDARMCSYCGADMSSVRIDLEERRWQQKKEVKDKREHERKIKIAAFIALIIIVPAILIAFAMSDGGSSDASKLDIWIDNRCNVELKTEIYIDNEYWGYKYMERNDDTTLRDVNINPDIHEHTVKVITPLHRSEGTFTTTDFIKLTLHADGSVSLGTP